MPPLPAPRKARNAPKGHGAPAWAPVDVHDEDVMAGAGEGGFVELEEMEAPALEGVPVDELAAILAQDGQATEERPRKKPRGKAQAAWTGVDVHDEDVMGGTGEGGFMELEEMDAPEGVPEDELAAFLAQDVQDVHAHEASPPRQDNAVESEDEEEKEEELPGVSPFAELAAQKSAKSSGAARLANHEGFQALLAACDCEAEGEESRRALAKEALTSEWVSTCGLDAFVSCALVHGCGFRSPTAIQRASLPHAVRGRQDIIGASQTGSGKTLAYVLPIARRLVNEHGTESRLLGGGTRRNPLRALALCPTRELAAQVGDHARAVLERLGFGTAVLVGGVAMPKQQRQLGRRPSFVVATPGRLWELMGMCAPPGTGASASAPAKGATVAARRQAAGLAHLGDLSGLIALVIDEADRMMERGHFAELAEIATRVAKRRQWATLAAEEQGIPPPDCPHLQTFVFSATLMLPPGVRGKLEGKKGKKASADVLKSLRNASASKGSLSSLLKMLTFHEDRLQIVDLTRGGVNATADAADAPSDEQAAAPAATPVAAVASKVTECALFASEEDKDVYLYSVLLGTTGRTMIFCNAVSVVRRLKSMLVDHLKLEGYSLFGEQQQKSRFKACEKFQESHSGIIVCTDVAARGLDFKDVALVVHYHVPRDVETYVHRSGRTGRGGVHGGEGLSLSLVAPGENTRFRRLRRAMAPGVADEAALTLPEYPIELGMLPMCRKRLVLASKLDSAKSKRKRGRAADAFTARHTEEMDLVGPEAAGGSSSDVAGDVTPDEERMEAELTRMLALPVGGGASASAAAVAAALGSGATQPRKRAALADELRERRASGGKALSKKARRRLEAERAALANERPAGPRGMLVITPDMHRAAFASAPSQTEGASKSGASRAGPRPLEAFRKTAPAPAAL